MSVHFPEGNGKIAWDRLVSKFGPHTASFLLKLKIEFHNSKLEAIEKKPDEWILNMEELKIWMNEFSLKGKTTHKDFMIHVQKMISFYMG